MVSASLCGTPVRPLGGSKLMLLSLVLSGLGTALLALTQHLLFLLVVFGVLRSIAQSGSSLSTTAALLSKWFHRQRATVMALNAAGASLGGLLLIPLTAAVIQRAGWRLAWVVLGLLVLGLAAPLAFCLLRDDPAEMGLRPDGEAQPSAMEQPDPHVQVRWRPRLGGRPSAPCPCGNSVGGTLSAASRLPSSPPISCHSPSNGASLPRRPPRRMA